MKDAATGRYEVRVADPTDGDPPGSHSRYGREGFSEGTELERQGTAESLRRAIAKREEALEAI